MVLCSTGRSVLKKYLEEFNKSPEYLVQAPGRVNLIGEHTEEICLDDLSMEKERFELLLESGALEIVKPES